MKSILRKKGGASPTLTYVIVAILVIGGYYYFIKPSAPSTPATPSGGTGIIPTGIIPSSGLTTLKLNFDDALATTSTPVIAKYYVTDLNGKIVSSGTADSSGQASIDLPYGQAYTVYAFNNSGAQLSGGGYYNKQLDISADKMKSSSDTEYMHLYKQGGVLITGTDTYDTDSNLTVAAGGTKNFHLYTEENKTRAAYQRLTFVLDINKTIVSSIDISGTKPVTCKNNITNVGKGRQYYCFMITDKEFIVPADVTSDYQGTIVFNANPSPATGNIDGINVSAYDQTMYIKSAAQTKDDFVIAGEDGSNYDVGALDIMTSGGVNGRAQFTFN